MTNGLIAVDKMGCKVLFLNPTTYATETVLDGFPRTVHELLVVPETGLAYVPIFGDGIHGRNPNPGHLLCIIDLHKRAHVGDIDLRPYIAPHTLEARAGRADLHHLREHGRGRGDRSVDPQGGRRDRLRLDQWPSPDHFARRAAPLHRERGRRHRLGDRPARRANCCARSRRRARSPASRSRPTTTVIAVDDVEPTCS